MNEGDVVTLIGGTVKMTAGRSGTDHEGTPFTNCVWHDSTGALQTASIHTKILTVVTPEPTTAPASTVVVK